MAGWINDYKMDYSPVVNALNSKYKDRAEDRAFKLKLLEAGGSLIGNGIDAYMRNNAYEEAKLLAAEQRALDKDELQKLLTEGKISYADALPYLMDSSFNFRGSNNGKL